MDNKTEKTEAYTVVKRHPKLAYFAGDVADLLPSRVKELNLIDDGFVVKK